MQLIIDTGSAVPAYEQLRAQLVAMVESGGLPTGTRLPPIRQLAGDLGLAVNTVGRAYRELELAGVAEARGRHGTVIVGTGAMGQPQRQKVVDAAADAFARSAQHHGASLQGALDAVTAAFVRLHADGTPVSAKDLAP